MARKKCFKIWGYFENGQSLIELSIFSVIIISAMTALVSYAMNYNQNQQVVMETFKKCKYIADEVNGINSALYATIFVVYDKALANPSMFGVPYHSPIMFSYSITSSNDLNRDLDVKGSELPRNIYCINGKNYIFRTAAYVYVYNYSTLVWGTKEGQVRRKTFKDNWNGDGVAWKWEIPSTSDDKRKFGARTSWDVDGDHEEEYIVAMNKNLDRLTVLDNQKGDIDLTINPKIEQALYNDAVKARPRKNYIRRKVNGLMSDTKTTISEQDTLINQQRHNLFNTATHVSRSEIIERRIRLNLYDKDSTYVQIRSQINKNNQCCYTSRIKPDINNPDLLTVLCPTDDPDLPGVERQCSNDEKDSLERVKDANGNVTDVFLVVRSKFNTDNDNYVWHKDINR